MKKYVYLFLCILLIPLASCSKEDRKIAISSQEEAIDKYVSSAKKDTVFYKKGAVRMVLKSADLSDGRSLDTLAVGDSVLFYYAGHLFSSGKGNLFHTNLDSVALAYKWPLREEETVVCRSIMGDGVLLKGLENGMIGMRRGERAYIIFNSDYGFGNKTVGSIPAMSALLFEIWVDGIIKK